jgi:bla regulator protein blaR1
VVPVFAEDKAPEETKVVKQKSKVIVIKSEDGKAHKIDISGDEDTPFVKTIEKDGKTIVLHSNKELTEAEVEKMVAEAEESRAKAEAKWGEAEAAKAEADAAVAEADAARAEASAARAEAHSKKMSTIRVRRHDGKDMAWTMEGDMMAAFIPEIDISEVRSNCKDGHPVSTNVSGFDGKNKSSVKIVMCGKGQAKLAQIQALKGLREARAEIERDKDIPEGVRNQVMDSLERQIDRMEDQISEEDESNSEA